MWVTTSQKLSIIQNSLNRNFKRDGFIERFCDISVKHTSHLSIKNSLMYYLIITCFIWLVFIYLYTFYLFILLFICMTFLNLLLVNEYVELREGVKKKKNIWIEFSMESWTFPFLGDHIIWNVLDSSKFER